VSEARTRPRPVADKIALWNRELFEELLPMQEEPDVPVVLACDDETLRVVGERLGYDAAGAAAAFALDVKVAFDVGSLNGFKYAVREPFETLPRPRWLTHSDHSRRQKDLVVPATKSPARAFWLGVIRVMLVWLARAKGVRTRPWRRPRPREHYCWRGPLLGVFDGGSFRVPLGLLSRLRLRLRPEPTDHHAPAFVVRLVVLDLGTTHSSVLGSSCSESSSG
jgi:hypothetical protein